LHDFALGWLSNPILPETRLLVIYLITSSILAETGILGNASPSMANKKPLAAKPEVKEWRK
jgi:hypothetical protein